MPIQDIIHADKQTLRNQGWDIDRLINDLSKITLPGFPFEEKCQFLLCKGLLGVPQQTVRNIWEGKLFLSLSDFSPYLSNAIYRRFILSNLPLISFSGRPSFPKIPQYCIKYLLGIKVEIPIALTTEKNQIVAWLQQTYPTRTVNVTQNATHYVIYVV